MSEWFLITGAAGGVGKAFCTACAKRGYNLFLTDISETLLNSLSRGLSQEFGIKITTYVCNLAKDHERDKLFKDLEKSGLKFAGLINIAGIDKEGEFKDLSLQFIRDEMTVNMLTSVEIINQVLKLRDVKKKFNVINLASLALYQPMPYKALYAATKRFIMHFSLGIREELKPYNVNVTTLCPNGMPTTATCIESIEAQGLIGRLTTMNTGDVAELALKKALKGRAVVIPGPINRVIMSLTSMLPDPLIAKVLQKRWSKILLKRFGSLKPQKANCGALE